MPRRDRLRLVAAVEVWSFVLLKFALHLHKWSGWDQIRLTRQVPVVLRQPEWARGVQLGSEQQSDFELEVLEASLCPHTTTRPSTFSSHPLSIVSSSFYPLPSFFFFSPLVPFFYPFFTRLFMAHPFSSSLLFPLISLFFFNFSPILYSLIVPLATIRCLITTQWTFAANCWWSCKRFFGTF